MTANNGLLLDSVEEWLAVQKYYKVSCWSVLVPNWN